MNNKVKTLHMNIGVDLIGAKTSLQTNRHLDLELTPIGVKAYSSTSKRTIIIPFSNIKGFELLPEQPESVASTDNAPIKRNRKTV